MAKIFEFRGVRGLVYAKVLTDDETAITFDDVKPLSGVAEIGKTTEASSEAKYYDNKPMIVIDSTGTDEITLTISALELSTLADITGQYFDATTGTMIEGERQSDYFAIGYITGGTDGAERYVWRYKGKFSIPDETNATEDDGTDSNNQELIYTGISTQYKFNKTGKSARALITDERYALADLTTFFDDVTTPDDVTPITPPSP
jgi:phi13 family phage major tail protein